MLTVYLYATVCYKILSPLPSHNDKNHLPLAELFPPIQLLTTRKTTIPFFPLDFVTFLILLLSIQTATFSESLPALKCDLHSVRYNLNFISQCPLLIKLYFWIIQQMSKKLNSTCCRRSLLHHQIISRVIISNQPIHVWWIVPPCVSNKKTNELWWHIIKCWIDHMKKRGSSASSKIHAIWEFSKIQQLRWGSQLIQ